MLTKQKVDFNYDGYDEYLYTGLQGYVMRKNHRMLSRGVAAKFNKKILDIGGGVKPHCSLVPLDGVTEYWISDSAKIFNKIPAVHASPFPFEFSQHVIDEDPHYASLMDQGHRFSRIIASHVWEHVDDPEGLFLNWVNLLQPDGQLDIAIPCDPGWLWRLGQVVSKRKAIRTYGLTSKAVDLLMAREHVNSCQNLMRIVRCYAKTRPRYYPFLVPVTDFNLFVFIRIQKRDIYPYQGV